MTVNVFDVPEIKELHDATLVISKQFDAANNKLSEKMLAWISGKLPDGTVIDLRHPKRRENKEPKPSYLMNVQVHSGTSRGTQIFRIESVCRVELNVNHPALSAWFASATPISEVTGKDMSGAAGNSKYSGKRLELKGRFWADLD